MKKLIFALAFATVAPLAHADPHFDVFCTTGMQAQPHFDNYDQLFTEGFRAQIPQKRLEEIFQDLYTQAGACQSYEVFPTERQRSLVTLHGTIDDVVLQATYDPAADAFSGLLIKGLQDTAKPIHSWDEVSSQLAALDPQGKLSATLTTPDKSVDLHAGDDGFFAIGSTFKLYVLGALQKAIAAGEHTWDEQLSLCDDWKSVGSGKMQDLPAGSPYSLKYFASQMISISDNTATDHLIHLLGRDKVEAMLQPMGNLSETAGLPFLTTLEMFKLKWAIAPSDTQNYVQMNREQRLAYLPTLEKIPRANIGTNGVDTTKPTRIDRLEWFATTEENCSAMFALADSGSQDVRDVLSINVPGLPYLGTAKSHWKYAGFKGGSEPGVLSMTFLLESQSGKRACLAMSWNDVEKPVSDFSLLDLIGRTLQFAESQIP